LTPADPASPVKPAEIAAVADTAAPIVALLSPRLSATLSDLKPLTFAAASPDLDLPGWVRGASAIRAWQGGHVVVQDDVLALAWLDEALTGACTALPLPAGVDGRRSFGEATGNKQHKLDLEAALVLPDGRLVLWGSGSRSVRERLVVLDGPGAVRVVDATDLYAHLHACADLAGAELNLEGAVCLPHQVRLFQRGNGAASGGRPPVDATADLDLAGFLAWLDGKGPAPQPQRVRRYDLGRIEGVRFGFTDAAALADGRVAFLAGAEASPDAYQGGAVLGCRFGIIEADGSAQCTEVRDASGQPVPYKLEGLCLAASKPEDLAGLDSASAAHFWAVVDLDDVDRPSRLGRLTVTERFRRAQA
jgi:hypothetical protein